ncbi:MAG: hypothetical protein NVS3B26_15080 [Mycobacteriales bacterium]
MGLTMLGGTPAGNKPIGHRSRNARGHRALTLSTRDKVGDGQHARHKGAAPTRTP